MALPADAEADASSPTADATDAAEAEADGKVLGLSMGDSWNGGNTNAVRLENISTIWVIISTLVSAVLGAVEVLRFLSAARRSWRLTMYFNSLNFLSLAVCKLSMWSISVLVWLSMNSWVTCGGRSLD